MATLSVQRKSIKLDRLPEILFGSSGTITIVLHDSEWGDSLLVNVSTGAMAAREVLSGTFTNKLEDGQ